MSTRCAPPEVTDPVLVVGFARTGAAVARVLVARGNPVTAVDDRPSAACREEAVALGVDLVVAPDRDRLAALAADAALVVVSPGVPPTHPVFSVAARSRVVSEIELAARLGGPPLVAVTGTNGKTTVTSLVAAMLVRSGIAARAAGNIGYPLVEAIGDTSLEAIVAEVSSFQLALTTTFKPAVGTWLNLAEDHLDWHADLDDYASAKERIWACQDGGDVAVANAEDPVVWERARRVSGRLVSFGCDTGSYHVRNGAIVGPDEETWASLEDLPRRLPHDVANAVAAVATAASAGATAEGVRDALREQPSLAHRVEHVGRVEGVDYFDDSKATTPSAVVAALAGFSSAVLIAGGHNKGLDLGAIAAAERGRSAGVAGSGSGPGLRAVVAIGDAADDVVRAFADGWPVVRALSMDEAVGEAARLARFGDAVLLSPGCASFDWYGSYEERGDDFVRAVDALRTSRTGGGRR